MLERCIDIFLVVILVNIHVFRPVFPSRIKTGNRNNAYNNIYKTNNKLWETRAGSASICLTFCSDHIDCHSVAFNTYHGKCQIYNRDFSGQPVTGVVENGWKHYDTSSGNNCDGGKIITTATHCSEVQAQGYNCSGVYTIRPSSTITVDVWCDLTLDGGRWTTIQRRQDGSVNFDQNWITYKNGFGNPSTEYWIGNEALFELTKSGTNELMILMESWDGVWKHARYPEFQISSEADKYRLFLSGFSGTAGDSLDDYVVPQTGEQFSTRDADNDGFAGSCNPQYHPGGWWFKNCGRSDLNGLYYNSAVNAPNSCHWNTFSGGRISLKTIYMMVRKV